MPFVRRLAPFVCLLAVIWSPSVVGQVLPATAAGGFAQPLQVQPAIGPQAGASRPAGDERTIAARDLTEAAIRLENAEPPLQDLAHAQALYCSAARDGFPDALVRLGWMYANGRGVKRDDAVAYTLFKRAGDLGSDMGQRLAQMLMAPKEKMPACLRAPGELAADEPEEITAKAAPASLLPQPTVEAPAQFRAGVPNADRRKLAETVSRMARQFMLDPRLVLALIQTESGFDPSAKSPKNAQGLMQLIPDTADRFAVKDILDPLENLRGGMSYLRWLLAYFRGDVVLTLAAYNAGEGAVDRFKGVPPFAETLAYVQRIRSLYPLDWHPYDPTATAASAALSGRAAALKAPVIPVRGSGG